MKVIGIIGIPGDGTRKREPCFELPSMADISFEVEQSGKVYIKGYVSDLKVRISIGGLFLY